MHPPFTGIFICYDARIDSIHRGRIICFNDTAFLRPWPFGRSWFGKSYIGCFTSECGYAIVEAVFIFIRDDIRCPDIGRPLPSCMRLYPLNRFFRYFRKCPSQKFPMYQILRTAHLDKSQRHAFLSRFFPVLTENRICRIHIIIVAQLPAGRIVYIVCSPLTVIFHFGYW